MLSLACSIQKCTPPPIDFKLRGSFLMCLLGVLASTHSSNTRASNSYFPMQPTAFMLDSQPRSQNCCAQVEQGMRGPRRQQPSQRTSERHLDHDSQRSRSERDKRRHPSQLDNVGSESREQNQSNA